MFSAFNHFRRPKDFIEARSALLDWLQTGEHFIGQLDAAGQFQATMRQLSETELAEIGDWLDNAWQGRGYAAYLSSDTDTPPEGFCSFSLANEDTEATLQILVLPQSAGELETAPLLMNTLAGLLRSFSEIERLTLGIAPTAGSDERIAELVEFLRQVDQANWRLDAAAPYLGLTASYEDEPATPEPVQESEEIPVGSEDDWLELSVRAVPEAVEPITELFAGYGYNQGVVIEEAVEPGPDGGASVNPTAPVTIRTYIAVSDSEALSKLDQLRQGLYYLGRLLPIEELQVTGRREEDWANAWKQFYQVHRVGRRTVIKPPWQEYTPQPEDIIVEIDPGMAFGTGLHPTTRLCLQLMEDHLDPAQHKKVLDLGTGSGILAIAAARLGIPYTLGLDTDPVAIESARQNVERNGMSDRLGMEAGSLAVERNESGEGGFYSFPEEAQRPPTILSQLLPFDAVIANIIARVLIALAGQMAAALRPGGLLITSGIIAERADEVAAALEAAGLTLVERREESDWVAFAHTRTA